MKKIFLTLCTVVLTLTGCSSTTEEIVEIATPTAEPTLQVEEITNEDKTLVVYFSATGHTEVVAEYISDYLDADIIELEPEEPYSSDDLNYNDSNSRVTLEHNDTSLQDVPLANGVIENIDEYSTIYVGYPTWWGDAAWPIYHFFTDNDLTDKTIICFTTSASSPLGNSVETLQSLSNGGNFLEGKRFSSSASEEEVIEWVDSLQ